MTAKSQGKIITFYSYKGGTGRTMALANVAWVLASSGHRVLAVDWDLEAPGLHRYFHPFLSDKACSGTPGVMDLVWDYATEVVNRGSAEPATDSEWYLEFTDLSRYSTSLLWPKAEGSSQGKGKSADVLSLQNPFSKGALDLMPAGRQGPAYAARVNTFDWQNFYERLGGGGLLEAIKERMRRDYDYVLIDSRTGVSDTSGICTVHLPDALVVCFTLNDQSIEGALAAARSVTVQRKGEDFRVFPVPMRLDNAEVERATAGRTVAERRFRRFLWHLPGATHEAYWGEVFVPYVPGFAFEEFLAAFVGSPKDEGTLLRRAERLAAYLTGKPTSAVHFGDQERERVYQEFKRDPPSVHIDDLLSAQEYFTRAAEHRVDAEDEGAQEVLGEELSAELPAWLSIAAGLAPVAERLAAAVALCELGAVCETLEREEAAECYRRALQIFDDLGDLVGKERAIADLARLEPTRPADIVQRHLQQAVSENDRAAVLALLRDYLNGLWTRLSPLPILAFSEGVSDRQDVPLQSVYTALDTETLLSVGDSDDKTGRRPTSGAGRGKLGGDRRYLRNLRSRLRREVRERRPGREEIGFDEGYSRRLTAVETLAASRRLVLLGQPGGGKSSFARHLALCFAGERLGREEANLRQLNGVAAGDKLPKPSLLPWPHGAPVPVFVELRRFVASPHFPGEGRPGTADQLLAFVDDEGRALASGTAEGSLRATLEDLFALPDGGLLILDGLDETPAAEASRERLREVIAAFAKKFPRSRILVTSRPYAYAANSPWRLDGAGFSESTLAPFDKRQVRSFIGGWYGHLLNRRQIDPERAERSRESLWQSIRTHSYLLPLAERPLMLTMMVDLHASAGGLLPAGRAELYERSVVLLLDRWNEVRGTIGVRSISDDLGVAVPQIRRALEDLAYSVHRDRGAAGAEEAAPITDEELWAALARELPSDHKVDRARLMDSLHQRSGILLAESPARYRFPHRSFQEFLAGCYLVRSRFPDLLCSLIEEDPALWREVLLLAAGKVAATPFAVWALLGSLVSKLPSRVKKDDPRFVPAFFAALAVEENGLGRRVEPEHAEELERIRLWLERTVELGVLSPVDRASAGRILGMLGDRRPGVGLSENGLPDTDWVEVPAGRFLMGSRADEESADHDEKPQREIDLPAFTISRLPVTHQQYAAFVEDGGYANREFWTEAGRRWKEKGKISGPDDDLPAEYLVANNPRVNVSWYEAHAYCEWFAKQLGHEVRLPTEVEWEKAARGPDGRVYPWGDRFDATKCNGAETGIGRPSAVGMFPQGASPFEVLDMSGNVWEWCATKWRGRYTEEADDDPQGNASRVLRGGAFNGGPRGLRCAYRLHYDPLSRSRSIGFRVAAPISVLGR